MDAAEGSFGCRDRSRMWQVESKKQSDQKWRWKCGPAGP